MDDQKRQAVAVPAPTQVEELEAARRGLFHRITGWDKDGQTAEAIADDYQRMRDWIDETRPIIERLMSAGATASGLLHQHHNAASDTLFAAVSDMAKFIAVHGWVAVAVPAARAHGAALTVALRLQTL